MLKIKKKTKIITDYKLHEQDTGSSEVQIALFTEEINQLVKHLKKHPTKCLFDPLLTFQKIIQCFIFV